MDQEGTMPTNSRRTKKQTGARRTKRKAAAAKGGIVTVKMPISMWELLHAVGSKIHTRLGSRTSKLNSKYADPICLALADNDEGEAAALQRQVHLAHRDFVKARGIRMKFAP
jgi:hypothetical protein